MQLTFVDLQGLVEAAAMETVQLSSHSNIPLSSVSSSISSVPLIENVYHLLNFLLSRRVRESSFLWSVRVGLITILYFIVLKNALFCFPNLSLS